jgi:hypothetical protein
MLGKADPSGFLAHKLASSNFNKKVSQKDFVKDPKKIDSFLIVIIFSQGFEEAALWKRCSKCGRG